MHDYKPGLVPPVFLSSKEINSDSSAFSHFTVSLTKDIIKNPVSFFFLSSEEEYTCPI